MKSLAYFKDEKQIQKAISNTFISLRKKNRLTQEKLAEILDVSVEHISRIENCKYTCSITLIIKMCSIFNLSLNDFFGIKNTSNETQLEKFFNDLPIDKREAIFQFCKEVESSLK